MKKELLAILFGFLIAPAYAQMITVTDQQQPFSKEVRWESNRADPNALPGSEVVSISSGNGPPIQVFINVDKMSAAVTIENCGTTTRIEPGSSAMCTTSPGPGTSIRIVSADPTIPARGSYQIKTQ